MSEVLQTNKLPLEAMNFIKAGVAKEQRRVEFPTVETASTAATETVRGLSRSEPQRTGIGAPPGGTPMLTSMTFRLPSGIPAALIRASADRKLAQKSPSSQQEIVAEALAQWFERNGY